MDYLWLKAAHVAAVMIFIGGVFVQAIGVAAGARGDAGAVALVSQWDRRVTLPAMLAVWLTGAIVAAHGGWFSHQWLQVKLLFVVVLSLLRHAHQNGDGEDIALARRAVGELKRQPMHLTMPEGAQAITKMIETMARRVGALQPKLAAENEPGEPACTCWSTPTASRHTSPPPGSWEGCSNNFWIAGIPELLFRDCAALRYRVVEPNPKQLDDFLFDLIKEAFRTLELAMRQTSNLRRLNAINASAKDRPPKRHRHRIIDMSVDGIPDAKTGKTLQVEAFDRLMLAVFGRVTGAKIRRDEGERTLAYH